jgi:hypothetical protein
MVSARLDRHAKDPCSRHQNHNFVNNASFARALGLFFRLSPSRSSVPNTKSTSEAAQLSLPLQLSLNQVAACPTRSTSHQPHCTSTRALPLLHPTSKMSTELDIDYTRRNKKPRPLSEHEKEKLDEFVDAIHYSARYDVVHETFRCARG